ncbi:3-hydroxyacyl-CoA dehydrogenase [Polaromonas naphthalenivorans]|uniref:3-hydroxyacyl-CoA dehydrogenase n=1 Tax=Polaromonas naphthalenivorans (strain CJ2) TaxID=365044 RepID=A1VRG1_POLNA|nr:3-hydroxyacyl-CoA dehydrogenase [Polaromonas naphthalenivorans]ABM38239.1 3-hydroxyacyl-CoA dehydrogenase [Polaromonas naphthalenivorans CJ2]
MTTLDLNGVPVLVVGAGIMGVGIAQVAAQAGHAVMLHDMREGAASQAKAKLARSLEALVAKGRLKADAVAQTLSRIRPIWALEEAVSAGLVVEAIVEKLDAKRALFQQLEAILAADCVLATNTSSISVTAIANGLQHPARLVGMHFFNPVPLMQLVEVVSGLQTAPAVAEAIFELCKVWGKVPVHARSTPGFIVNRIARPYYAETLALLHEQAATPAVLDACLRAAGFRMGPCELMDLIGHDTNFSVTNSVYEANFHDKRFVPSLVQRELVDGGLLGRKSGRGFYDYADGAAKPAVAALESAALPPAQALGVHGRGPVAERLAATLAQAGRAFHRDEGSDWVGLAVDGAMLRLTDGRPASQLGADVAVFDLPLSPATGIALAWAPSCRASAAWVEQASHWLLALGFNPQRIADAPGLVVARTIAMLINEAMDAVQQGVCTPEGADAAMKLGVNYPAGPFEWLARWDAGAVIGLLDALDGFYRGERYRVSPALRQRAWQQAPRQAELATA